MKKRSHFFLLAILLLVTGAGYAQLNKDLVPGKLFRHIYSGADLLISQSPNPISTFDSIYFDLSLAYQITSVIDIPVYFRSGNTINSLDFAVQYNLQKAVFDTIIVPSTNLQYIYYYNPQDSTLRFSSNWISAFPQDSVIAIMRFEVFSGPFCSGDLLNAETWLNGDACSHMILNCVISGIEEENAESSLLLYPNPAKDQVVLKASHETNVQLVDVLGKLIDELGFLPAHETRTFNISNLSNGIYFIKVKNKESVSFSKLIVSR